MAGNERSIPGLRGTNNHANRWYRQELFLASTTTEVSAIHFGNGYNGRCAIVMNHAESQPTGECQAHDMADQTTPMNLCCQLRRLVLRLLSAVERRAQRWRTAINGERGTFVPALTTPRDESRTATTPTMCARSGRSLRDGDTVEVLTYDEIAATLDAGGRCDGLFFMSEMKTFCGRAMVIKKRVRMLFDERTHRMLRVKKNRYLLEGAMCHGTHAFEMEGCDRCCYFFWTDRWFRTPSQTGSTTVQSNEASQNVKQGQSTG